MTTRRLTKSADPRFYGSWDLDQIEVAGLKFWIRPDTSDIKAIRECVGTNGRSRTYDRYKHGPAAGEHWLDLGANIGAFTVLAASRGAVVDAYEPDPVSFAIAAMNVKANRLSARVKLHPEAVVGDTPAEPMTLSVNGAKGNYWRNSLYHEWRGGFDIPVDTIELDEVLGPWEPGLWNLKMDCEGAEMALIEQSDRSLWGRLYTEWSFDIDKSIPRFHNAMGLLRATYETVKEGGAIPPDVTEWPASWFPACRTVVAW